MGKMNKSKAEIKKKIQIRFTEKSFVIDEQNGGYTEEIATNWVEEQVENFKNHNNHKPYLQDKILA